MQREYNYNKGEDSLLDQEFAAGQQYGKVKLADRYVFWKQGLRWKCAALAEVKQAFRRVEAVNTKMCCGSVNFDIQKLVLILKDGTELEILIGEGTLREAEKLFELMQEKNTGIQFGK